MAALNRDLRILHAEPKELLGDSLAKASLQ